jgi:predicted RNA-binding protein
MCRLLMVAILVNAAAWAAPPNVAEPSANPVIDRGYRQMYDLNFDEAHKTFAQWERDHPADPIGPVSNAAAYLFAEFDRLNILHSEFFVDNSMFHRRPKITPDAVVRQAFDQELEKSAGLSDKILSQTPEDPDALFAKILTLGLRADYEALIERRDFDALKVIKTSRATAEKLLMIQPNYYDAYLAIGVENYLFSLKPAPMRWILQAGGAQTDHDRGVEDLRLTAEKGRYLNPYARLLLAVAALRDKDVPKARDLLGALAREFPHNRLYAQELARLR